MPAVIRSKNPLSEAEIIEQLGKLRTNCLVESSHFTVTAMIEVVLLDNSYVYFSGVNVENKEHNRLGLHAEQNAIAAAQTLLGGDAQFSKVWVMGAPDTIQKGDKHVLADNFVTPCGHCRQILLSLSTAQAEAFSVSVNGKISSPTLLTTLLPKAFSERDLDISSPSTQSSSSSNSGSIVGRSEELIAFTLVENRAACKFESINEIKQFLSKLKPHIVNREFITSPILSCAIKIKDSNYYVLGTLVQDIAFLTTDALFTAVGSAITEFGKQIKIDEVHLLSHSLEVSQFSGSEIEHLKRFASSDKIPINFYTKEGKDRSYPLSACLKNESEKVIKPKIIGIAGASGSGKSTVSSKLLEHFTKENCLIISTDNYYKDQTQIAENLRPLTNYDHPDSIDFSLLAAQLQSLLNNEEIMMPNYDFKTHNRTKDVTQIKPKPFIIIEGILTLHAPELAKLLEVKIFVKTDPYKCYMRRKERDIIERGRTAEQVDKQFMATVFPMYDQFVEPSKSNADIVLKNVADNLHFKMTPVIEAISNKFNPVEMKNSELLKSLSLFKHEKIQLVSTEFHLANTKVKGLS